MIGRLTGQASGIEDGRCLIDVQGVGYVVQASTRTLAGIEPAPAITRLLIETHVREDAITLYGFAGTAERDWFRLLTTVQGVGAKVALGILSALAPDELAATIAAGDRAHLTRAPGVGAKLAARLLTELRDKAGALPAPGAVLLPAQAEAPGGGIAADALSALLNLGYRRAEAQPAIARALAALGEAAALDAVIRDSLRELAR